MRLLVDTSVLVDHLRETGEKDEIWARVEPHVVPGRELKARHAFDDLWEALHGRA